MAIVYKQIHQLNGGTTINTICPYIAGNHLAAFVYKCFYNVAADIAVSSCN